MKNLKKILLLISVGVLAAGCQSTDNNGSSSSYPNSNVNDNAMKGQDSEGMTNRTMNSSDMNNNGGGFNGGGNANLKGQDSMNANSSGTTNGMP